MSNNLTVGKPQHLTQQVEKDAGAEELINAKKELIFEKQEKQKRAAELAIADKELAFQTEEKSKRAAELAIANHILAFETKEKKKRAAELLVADKELAFQTKEKSERAAELIIAAKELAYQQKEKGKRVAELAIADKELAFQTEEKSKRAAELAIANQELAFETEEKKKRAAELLIADIELALQTKEKGERAAELIIAAKELILQNSEKESRAAAFLIANKELIYQNEEKEKRAAELIIANIELAFQNEEKEKRAIELAISNEELIRAKSEIVELNIGLEKKVAKRTADLEAVNRELESFSYSVSHDLRAPLRAINGFGKILLEDYAAVLDAEGQTALEEMITNSKRMGLLIDNLLEFSHLGKQGVSLAEVNMKDMVTSIVAEQQRQEAGRTVIVKIKNLLNVKGDRNMLKQVFVNLVSNAFKYSNKVKNAVVEIGSYEENFHTTFYVKDNGAGFDMRYYDKLFGVFQRLHSNTEYEGTGVGLAIIHRIISRHNGKVWAEGKVNGGACFYVSLPIN